MRISLRRNPGDGQARAGVTTATPHLSRKLLATAATCLTALILTVVWLAWKVNNFVVSPPASSVTSIFTETLRRYYGNPGPWGNLEYTRIAIARPDPFVYIAVMDTRDSRWHFSRPTLEAVKGDLDRSGFTADQVHWLVDSARCLQRTNGWRITPGSDFILQMDSKTRQAIYAVLAKDEANPSHSQPLSWREDGLDEWMEGGALSPETIKLVNRLLYPHGNAWCFSDMPTALSRIPDVAEKKRLIKALSRNNTLMMKLRIPYGADISALAEYWSVGGRAKDVVPLLESLAQIPGGASIDITHFLPLTARSRLYTYEYPPRIGTVSQANCFWTAMNFFNAVPDDRFTSLTETLSCLRDNYVIADGDPQLGEVLMFERPGEGYIHAAVYIADDVLFTKNGYDHNQPWLLMRKEDLLARYPSSPPLNITRYRSKHIIWQTPRNMTSRESALHITGTSRLW